MSYEEGGDEPQDGNPYAALEAKYAGKTTLELIHAMAETKADKESREEELKVVNKEYDFLRLKAIPTKFEDEGIEVLKVEGVGRVSLTGDMYVSMIKPAFTQFKEWLRDHGSESLVVETINASTLKAAVKQWIKKGEEPPEQFLKVTPFTRASITKA